MTTKDISKLTHIFSNKHSKILFQYPLNDDYTMKLVFTLYHAGLSKAIPRTLTDPHITDDERSIWIRQKNVYIIQPDRSAINVITVHNAINDPDRVYKESQYNVHYGNAKTFDYWGLPEHSFDLIIAEKPVKLNMLKTGGILIK